MVVHVLMERQYIAKFALIFYRFLVFGHMFTTLFISYRISLAYERILQFTNGVFLNSPSRYRIQNLGTEYKMCINFLLFFFLKAKAFYLNYFTDPSKMQSEQYILEAGSFSLVLLKILWSFQKTRKKSTVEFSFCFHWRVCLLCALRWLINSGGEGGIK